MFRFIDMLGLGDFATFVPNKSAPIYNWLYYKEGFAPQLVSKVTKMFDLQKGATVLDPFCGVGTTQLACKQLAFHSIGFDVSTVALFAAKVKLADYKVAELREAVKKIGRQKFQRPNVKVDLPIVHRAFSKYALEDIFFFRQKIDELFRDEKVRDFLMLGVINTSTKCTLAEKSGGMIKINPKRHVPPFRPIFLKTLKHMISDLEHIRLEKVSATAEKGDARKLPLEDETVDAVITSPPYLNKIEYTNVYAIEQYLFFGEESKPAVRSYIGEDVSEVGDVFEGKYELPEIAKAYFKDLKMSLEEMFRVLKKGGKAAIVVGEGCFSEGVIHSDELLAELAEQIGFTVNEIQVLNKRWCMRNRTEKVGIMRESMILIEKAA